MRLIGKQRKGVKNMTIEQIITMIACFVMGYSVARMVQIYKTRKTVKCVNKLLESIMASIERQAILNKENTKSKDDKK